LPNNSELSIVLHLDQGMHRRDCIGDLHRDTFFLQQLDLDVLREPSRVRIQLDGLLYRIPVHLLVELPYYAGKLRTAAWLRVDDEHDTLYRHGLLFVPHDASDLCIGSCMHLEDNWGLRRHAALLKLFQHHHLHLLHRPRLYLGFGTLCLYGHGCPNLCCHDDEHVLLQFVHGLHLVRFGLQRDRNTLQYGSVVSDEFLRLPNVVRMFLVQLDWQL
jgi:hypothetical protein